VALGEIYLKLAVAFPNDPKVRSLARFGAPDAGLARDLYVQMCLHCKEHLTDGHVSAEQIGLLVYPLDPEHGNQLAKQLASVELIKEEASGWQVLAYVRRNGTREDVEKLSKVRAEAGRTGGRKSRKRPAQNTRKATGKQVANQDGQQTGSNAVSVSVKTTETETQTPTESGPQIHAGDVVAAFVDGAVAAGLDEPAGSIRARVGRAARQLLTQGKDPAALIESARRMGASEYDDLAKQFRIDDARAKGAGGNGQSSAPDRARGWMAAGREVQEEIDHAGRELPGGR
jgi:hypothetical protein